MLSRAGDRRTSSRASPWAGSFDPVVTPAGADTDALRGCGLPERSSFAENDARREDRHDRMRRQTVARQRGALAVTRGDLVGYQNANSPTAAGPRVLNAVVNGSWSCLAPTAGTTHVVNWATLSREEWHDLDTRPDNAAETRDWGGRSATKVADTVHSLRFGGPGTPWISRPPTSLPSTQSPGGGGNDSILGDSTVLRDSLIVSIDTADVESSLDTPIVNQATILTELER